MRICLYGGPGTGKSRMASRIYSDSAFHELNIEIVSEYIKKWAYEGRVPTSFDQVYIFGHQLHREDLLWQQKVDHLVTDSPLFLSAFYARRCNFPCWKELAVIASEYEKIHDSLNIFLNRDGVSYKNIGRFHSENDANNVDSELKAFLNEFNVKYKEIKTLDYNQILSYIKENI